MRNLFTSATFNAVFFIHLCNLPTHWCRFTHRPRSIGDFFTWGPVVTDNAYYREVRLRPGPLANVTVRQPIEALNEMQRMNIPVIMGMFWPVCFLFVKCWIFYLRAAYVEFFGVRVFLFQQPRFVHNLSLQGPILTRARCLCLPRTPLGWQSLSSKPWCSRSFVFLRRKFWKCMPRWPRCCLVPLIPTTG